MTRQFCRQMRGKNVRIFGKISKNFEGLAYLPVFYPKENVIVHEVVKLHDLFPLICQAKAFDWRSFIDVV